MFDYQKFLAKPEIQASRIAADAKTFCEYPIRRKRSQSQTDDSTYAPGYSACARQDNLRTVDMGCYLDNGTYVFERMCPTHARKMM